MKFFYYLSMLALVIAATTILIWQEWPDDHLHVIACDVGQGDAILVTYGFQQLLIDGGPNDDVLQCLGEELPFWDRTIEVVVATHADADHIGGLPAVLNRYYVDEMIVQPYQRDTEVFSELKSELADALMVGTTLKAPFLGQQMRFSLEKATPKIEFSLGLVWPKLTITDSSTNVPELVITTLSPREIQGEAEAENCLITESTLSAVNCYFSQELADEDQSNNESIVLFLEFGNNSVILTGDLEIEGELALVQESLVRDVDILKVGHHGSKTSTDPQFIEIIRPEISLVSVGENNRFGHPSPEVMNRLMHFDSQVLRTDLLGTIEIIADGDQYWVKTDQN